MKVDLQTMLTELAVMFASQYRTYGKAFITCVVKFRSQQMALDMAVRSFEKNISKYEADEKIENYVDGMKLEDREASLLKRGLKMIKIISS